MKSSTAVQTLLATLDGGPTPAAVYAEAIETLSGLTVSQVGRLGEERRQASVGEDARQAREWAEADALSQFTQG